MSRVRALDENHDWLFGKGANDYKQANAAIVQNIDTRLSCFLNDCFFDTGAGLDWFTFLGGSKDQLAVNLAVSAVILNTPDVVGLLQLLLNLNHVTREISIQYRVQTIYSQAGSTYQYSLNGIG